MAWLTPKSVAENELASRPHRPSMNSSKPRSDSSRLIRERGISVDFVDKDLDDADLLQAAGAMSDLDFVDIDDHGPDIAAQTKRYASKNARQREDNAMTAKWQPKQLLNGKWACNHACKSKNTCKHLCCRDGLDKPPKAPKNWQASGSAANEDSLPKATQNTKKLQKGQTTLKMTGMKIGETVSKVATSDVEYLDLTENPERSSPGLMSEGLKHLHRLHSAVQKDTPNRVSNLNRSNDSFLPVNRPEQQHSFLPSFKTSRNDIASDYGDSWPDDIDLPDLHPLADASPRVEKQLTPSFHRGTEETETHERAMISNDVDEPDFGDVDSMLEATMVGLADSQDLQAETCAKEKYMDIRQAPEAVCALPITSKRVPFPELAISSSLDNHAQAHEDKSEQVAFRNPFMQSSSPLFRTIPAMKRSIFFKGVGEQAQRATKRSKKSEDVELQDIPPLLHGVTPIVPVSEVIDGSDKTDTPAEPEGVDKWLMQEFGQYVNFI
jgi:ATP-dependent DNA helicase HFM1/MER3